MNTLEQFTDMLGADPGVSPEFKQAMIPTSDGMKSTDSIFSDLMYGSYEANRGYGMTHEQLISIGIGNDAMKAKFESPKDNTQKEAA